MANPAPNGGYGRHTEQTELTRVGALLPAGLAELQAAHRESCKLCRHPDLAELEQRFLTWTPVAQLAQEYGVHEATLRRHTGAFLLELRRVAELAPAWSRLVEVGLQALDGDDQAVKLVPPELLIRVLQALQPRPDRLRPGQAPTVPDSFDVPAASGWTYEERIRRVRTMPAEAAEPDVVDVPPADPGKAGQMERSIGKLNSGPSPHPSGPTSSAGTPNSKRGPKTSGAAKTSRSPK